MKDILTNLIKYDTWKIQLTIGINSLAYKDIDQKRVMHSKSDTIDFMIYDEADEFIQELYESLLSISQIRLEATMKHSDFIFDYVNLLHYKFHKVNLKRGGSYMDSSDGTKKKRNNNPINDDD